MNATAQSTSRVEALASRSSPSAKLTASMVPVKGNAPLNVETADGRPLQPRSSGCNEMRSRVREGAQNPEVGATGTGHCAGHCPRIGAGRVEAGVFHSPRTAGRLVWAAEGVCGAEVLTGVGRTRGLPDSLGEAHCCDGRQRLVWDQWRWVSIGEAQVDPGDSLLIGWKRRAVAR